MGITYDEEKGGFMFDLRVRGVEKYCTNTKIEII